MIIYTSGGVPIIDIEVDDASYRYRGLMRSDELTLVFSLTQHVELPVGAYCTFEATDYHLLSLANVTVHHRRDYEYTVRMYGPGELTKNFVIYNTVDKRLRFEQSGTPREHLQQIIDNLNAREGSGWTIGECIDGDPKIIAYNYTTCWDGIVGIAQTYNTEFEIVGRTVSIKKVEYHKDEPLALAYGAGNGLRTGVKREEASMGIGRVYIQGGDRNIGLDNYDAKTLHLPKGVTFNFDGTDFVGSGGVSMTTSADGLSVALTSAAANVTEASLDLSHIYPSREGTVSEVVYEYKKNYYSYAELIAAFPNLTEDDWYDIYVHFCDSSIPPELDYDECLMGNDEPLTVIFQGHSGMLLGREFNVTFDKEAKTKTVDGQTVTVIPANRFEMEHATIDGVDMPNGTFRPAVGDKYAIFNCALPQAYINAGAQTKEGAEWEALKEAAKYLHENMEPKVSYKGDLDSLFSKGNWLNIGDYLKCGSYISFSDPAVQPAPILVRIVGVRQYVNRKECPTIEFSNDTVSPTLSSAIQQLKANEAHVEALSKQNKQYSQRSFHSAKETMRMLIDAALEGYTEQISPIAVQTMQLIAGDERLQFKFFTSAACTTETDPVHYDPTTKQVTFDAAYLKHFTLGIDSIAPDRTLDTYKVWPMTATTSAVLSDTDEAYYLYARVGTDTTVAGTYSLERSALDFEVKSGSTVTGYNLLIGILNSEVDGERSYAPLYGFTEILPGQITTDKIRSSDGNSYLDLAGNKMRFGDASRSLSWNLNGDGEFRISGGTIVQSSAGAGTSSLVTCDRGAYDADVPYYYADEVYLPSGARYVYINKTTPSTGRTPTDDGTYWQLKQDAIQGAQLISLVESSLFFTYDTPQSTSPSGDQTITLTAVAQNVTSPQFVWKYRNASNGWTQISGATMDTLTVYPSGSPWADRWRGKELGIRVEISGNPNLYDEVTLYKLYGSESPLVADLNNDMDGVALTSDGVVKDWRSVSLVTTATLWKGTQQQTLTGATISGLPTGWTYTRALDTTSATFTLRPAQNGTVLDTTQKVMITLTSAAGSASVEFTILGIRDGDSQGATIYSLKPSQSAFVREKDGSISPAAYITCGVQKTSGGAVTDGFSEGDVYYYLDDETSPRRYTLQTQEIYVGTAVGQFQHRITFEFDKNGQTLDRETIFVIDDGEDGLTAFLTNSSHLFAGDENAALGDTDTFSVKVFRGATPVPYNNGSNNGFTIGTITGQIAGKITAQPSNDTITVTVTSTLTQKDGVLTIPVIVDGQTINLTYSWAISFAGHDGVGSIVADMDNEMDGVTVNANGLVTSAVSLYTTVSLWYGTEALTLTAIGIVSLPSGFTYSRNLTTGVVTINIAAGTAVGANVPITISVTGTKDGTGYTKELVYTVAGIPAGADGDDAVIYSILPSVSAVKKDKDNHYSVPSVTCTRYKRVGQDGLTPTTDGTLKYSLDGGTEATYTSAIPTANFDETLTFLYYINSVLVDKETVPMLIDGEDGGKGDRGAKLRGPTRWVATNPYESGKTTEFQDLVIDGDLYYLCVADISGSSNNPHPANDLYDEQLGTGHWIKSNKMDFVATEVFFADKGKIDNLVIDYLYTTDEDNDEYNPISIHGKTITISDSDPNSATYKDAKVTLSSDHLDISGNATTYPSMASPSHTFSFSAPGSVNLDYTLSIGSVSVSGVNNTVTLPAITMNYTGKTSGSSILCYCRLMLGDRVLETTQLNDSTSSVTIGGGVFNLPAGTHAYYVALSGSFYSDGSGSKQVKVKATAASSSGTVAYSNDFRVIASDGMQLSYGYEGIKITPIVNGEGGAKVIQGGNEYKMLGGDVYNSSVSSSLVAPIRIVVCDDYPPSMSADVLYIKVSNS